MPEKRINIGNGFLVAAISVLFIIFGFIIAEPVEAEAASSYKEISVDFEKGKPVKVNGYYFKYNKKDQLCISKKKTSKYTNTKINSYETWTNGKTIYYIKNYTSIYKYTISSKKSKKVKNLSSVLGKYGDARIKKIYKGKIYFTKENEKTHKISTYFYNTKTKKIKKVKANADIIASSGKYCVCKKEMATAIYSTYTLVLYKITSSGKFKKIKTLTKKGYNYVEVIGGKFYYVKYSNTYSFDKASVYRIKKTGVDEKKLITVSDEDYMIIPTKISANFCSFEYYDDYGDKEVLKYYY